MMDVLLGIGLFLTIGAAAVVLLACRDSARKQHKEESTPIPVRIEQIRHDAAFMVRQFQHAPDHWPLERIAAVGSFVEYYRRLEDLAAASHPSEEQALRLAEEAGRYIRETGLKGVFVDREARKLAELARRLMKD